jgi:hypothetical protein
MSIELKKENVSYIHIEKLGGRRNQVLAIETNHNLLMYIESWRIKGA